MPITRRGFTSNPADNATLYDSVERNIDPTGLGCATNDLVILRGNRRGLSALAMNKTGGQTWNHGSVRQTGSSSALVNWCVFNGAWDALNLPSFVTDGAASECIQLYLDAWIPSSPSNTWILDITESFKSFVPPIAPGDCQANAVRTTTGASVLAIYDFLSVGANSWLNRSSGAGWANAGAASGYRNLDPATSRPLSMSSLYKLFGATTLIDNPTNRQNSGTLQNWMFILNAWREQGAGVTVTSVNTGATPIENGQTGVVFTGAKVGASWASAKVCAVNAIGDASAVNWPISSSTATTMTMAAAPLSSFSYYPSTLYVFFTDSGGNSNSSGFPIQRGSSYSVALVLQDKLGNPLASQTFAYNVWATGINGTELDSGSIASDGSGNWSVPKKVFTPGVNVTPGDDLYIEVFKDASPAANSKSGSARIDTTTGLSYT